ncbi:MAG: hypothetical protein M1825_001792 [Sarcosagium campestre]|nr:MAG: hypothetical protein M1825_001792 [Sarcosagium campestre]
MTFLGQAWTLTAKNLRIAYLRHSLATTFRAFILPIVFMVFLSYSRNLFIRPSQYGIGEATTLRSLSDAMDAATGGRETIAFVNNGLTGGDIDRVIATVSAPARAQGKTVRIVNEQQDLLDVCRSSIRAVSNCYAAAVFWSSPNEGRGGKWNYTIRADGALGDTIKVDKTTNDVEIYTLPLQHTIDFAIASLNDTVDQAVLSQDIQSYPYTDLTQKERENRIRTRFMGGIIDILAVAFFIAMVGIVYQMVGFIATERELGMSQLIDAMMPNLKRWQPQAARLLSHHLAFDILYAPAWIIMSFILARGVFGRTNIAIVLIFNILSGLSLSSFSLFGAAFFKKAQLSGISNTIILCLLGVLGQVISKTNSGGIIILGLLFPPMTYVFFIIFVARWERQDVAANLVKSAPESPWGVPGIVLWILLVIQILVFPLLAALLERGLYGTASKGRDFSARGSDSPVAVQLSGFSKHYRPNWFVRHVKALFGRRQDGDVIAVNQLSLSAGRGQIVVLLGANGSGKTTTLEAIAGLSKVGQGSIAVDSTGGLGLCPQKNVLWDELTAEEHVRIFNRLKCTGLKDTKEQIKSLITACDLGPKRKAQAKTLSGGQKRKLQLAMMFTGGSKVCCVDEVSSGLDPLSRRKIWDILLAERGARTILLTTHFLDEADLLADHIAILSKGTLRVEGSAVELKSNLGEGYRVHLYNSQTQGEGPDFDGVARKVEYDRTVYSVPDSVETARLIARLEAEGIDDYQVTGPTIEDVFLKVAEEVDETNTPEKVISRSSEGRGVHGSGKLESEKSASDDRPRNSGVQLLTGKRIGMARQAWVLFRKRVTILRRNYLPYCAAFLIPVIAAGLVTLFLKDFKSTGCAPEDNVSSFDVNSLATLDDVYLVLGPSSRISPETVELFASSLPIEATAPGGSDIGNMETLFDSIHLANTIEEFNDKISSNYANVTPGGFFLGDGTSRPTFAYKANNYLFPPLIIQNAFDVMFTNVSIGTQYAPFDVPWQPDSGKALQLITYFGLAMSVYPAFFALYPTVERLRNVRALHYSNGVRSVPLWAAYVAFDFCFVLAASVLAIVIFAAKSSAWFNIGYLFLVFLLYGISSTLLSYVISIFSRSQLAAFAFAATGQCGMFLIYFIAYLSVYTYSPIQKIDSNLNIVHYTIATITPSGNLIRSLFVALNVFTIDCNEKVLKTNAGEIGLYGGPILYLILQSVFMFGLLLWLESGSLLAKLRKSSRPDEENESETQEKEVLDELHRVSSSPDGLRVLHVTKKFGSTVAVQDVTFGVPKGEVFALLGPNGAGKSTTISLIRGDIQPTHGQGEILVQDISIAKHRAAARSHLGVCPQFDAMDVMTAHEHLYFYARIRGVPDVEHNVREVVKAVGLQSFTGRMAGKLSGGNKRKLSLGIALMGNPAVLLLDEPSSGMDAASKRVMWRTLASVVPGRSLVLTTHSMEEADALADRAGIMAGRMLALGTSDYLRQKHGNAYFVHLVTKTAPHSSDQEMQQLREWVIANVPGAQVEDRTYHGQMKFSVPAVQPVHDGEVSSNDDGNTITPDGKPRRGVISVLFSLLSENKEALGLEHYSVSQTTLDQVFLAIVGKHNVEEENSTEPTEKKRFWQIFRK